MFKLSFQVQKILYRIDNYAIIQANKFETSNQVIKKKLGRTMRIKGYFNTIFEGDRFIGEVEILEDKNGEQYLHSKKFFELVKPEKNENLAKFIAKRVRGLSLKKSKEIVMELGLDCMDKIMKDPSVLYDNPIFKITKIKAENIAEQLQYCQRYEEVGIFVQSAGLPLYLANTLYEKYKDDTIDIIRENPYQICYDGIISFKDADRLANECKIKYNNKLRIQTGIYDYLLYMRDVYGYTCVYKDEKEYKSKKNFYQLLNQYLKKNGTVKGILTNDEINSALDTLLADKKVVEEVNGNKKYLYTMELYITENSIAKNLNRIRNTPFKLCEKSDIDDYFKTYQGFPLDPKQKDAIYNALTHPISILTGGPGTGKTATVNILVQATEEIILEKKHRKAKIELLGPTGKAADRMQELTNRPASTIHRKLRLRPGSNFVDVELDADLIIVDESSMIDIYLMDKLLSAISSNTIIVFVGDINQLPSVGPGKVLDDMIASNKISTVTLTTIFRQSQNSTIVENAHHIINEEDTEHGFKLNEGNFTFIPEDNPVELKTHVGEVIELEKSYGNTLKDIITLTLMRDKDGGTAELNEYLQENYNPNPIEYDFMDKVFKVGDRVMQIRNNYDLKVFNGFVGTINSIYEENGEEFLTVDYDNQTSITEYGEKEVNELDLAYASTVHKSQGSEYPIVILIIHNCQAHMLTSKILYTALTRAKVRIYCIGQVDAINKAIHEKNKNKNEYRLSRLALKIK